MAVWKGEFKWYSDGFNELMLHYTEEVPAGFYPGRSKTVKKKIQAQVTSTMNNLSDEKRQEISEKIKLRFQSRTEEEQLKINASISQGVRAYLDNLTPEERAKDKLRRAETIKTTTANRSPESWQQSIEKCKETIANRTPERQEEIKEKNRQMWKNLTLEQYNERLKHQGEGVRAAFAKKSPEELHMHGQKVYLSLKAQGKLDRKGTSTQEDEYYKFLLTKYNSEDIIRWYGDDIRYPFCCDFYIKSEDLFIEFNLFWTHNDHPYNESDPNDLLIKEKWQQLAREKEFYAQALYQWIDLDVRKFETAKRNNLNYKMVYKEEFKQCQQTPLRV